MRIKRVFSILVCVMCLVLSVSCGANQGKTNQEKASDVWICSNCGKEASGNFCTNCGAAKPDSVSNNSGQSNSSSANSEQPKSSSGNSNKSNSSSENSKPANNDGGNSQTALAGEWFGQVPSQSSSDEGKIIDVYLTINSDGTWFVIEDGGQKSGTWKQSGNMLALLNTDSKGEQKDNGWYFGQMGGKKVLGFNDWYHYDVEMNKVEAAPISIDDLFGEWSGQIVSQFSYNEGEVINVFLTINSDGTWMAVEDGSRKNGNWKSISGSMLSLTNTDSEGEEKDNGWYFGRLNGKFIFGFNDWHHYDAEMSK